MGIQGLMTRHLVIVMVAALVVAGLGTMAVTQLRAHGGDASLIHSCVKDSGKIKIVDSAQDCKDNETAVDWGAGPHGAGGGRGAPSLYTATSSDVDVATPSAGLPVAGTATAACDSGDQVTGGEFNAPIDIYIGPIVDIVLQVTANGPNATGDGWEVSVLNFGPFTAITATAVCVDVALPAHT